MCSSCHPPFQFLLHSIQSVGTCKYIKENGFLPIANQLDNKKPVSMYIFSFAVFGKFLSATKHTETAETAESRLTSAFFQITRYSFHVNYKTPKQKLTRWR